MPDGFRTPEDEIEAALAQEERARRLGLAGRIPGIEEPARRVAVRGEIAEAIDPATLLPAAGAVAAGLLPQSRTLAGLRFLGQVTRFPSLLEGAGAAVGETLRQAAREPEFDIGQALTTGGIVAAAGGAARGLFSLLGKAAGIAPSAMREVGGEPFRLPVEGPTGRRVITARPPFTPIAGLRRVSPASQTRALRLAKNIRQASQSFASKETVEFEQTVRPFLNSGEGQSIRISTSEIQEAFAAEIRPNALGQPRKLANAKINKMLDDFNTISEANGGQVSAKFLHEFIDDALDPSIFSQTGKPSNTLVARALRKIRKTARGVLGRNVPPDVNDAIIRTGPILDQKKAASKAFVDKNPGQVSRLLSNLFEPGNETALEALNAVDPTLVQKAKIISTQRKFNPREQGFVGSVLNSIMGILGPFQTVAGPAAALVTGESAARESRMRERRRPSFSPSIEDEIEAALER